MGDAHSRSLIVLERRDILGEIISIENVQLQIRGDLEHHAHEILNADPTRLGSRAQTFGILACEIDPESVSHPQTYHEAGRTAYPFSIPLTPPVVSSAVRPNAADNRHAPGAAR